MRPAARKWPLAPGAGVCVGGVCRPGRHRTSSPAAAAGGRKLVLNRMVRVAPEHGAHTGGEHIGTVRRARGVVAAWQDGVGARVPFHQREMIRICRG